MPRHASAVWPFSGWRRVLPGGGGEVGGGGRKMVQTGSGELARGMQSGQWPAEVGRQLAEVQKQFSLLNQMTSAPATTTAQLASDAADFRQALQTLKAAPVSTSSIRNELELADSQWLFFESALRRPADDAGLNAVATTSERLLGVMDKLTGLYDAALREVLG